jgi:hypothetical protein
MVHLLQASAALQHNAAGWPRDYRKSPFLEAYFESATGSALTMAGKSRR